MAANFFFKIFNFILFLSGCMYGTHGKKIKNKFLFLLLFLLKKIKKRVMGRKYQLSLISNQLSLSTHLSSTGLKLWCK